MVLADKVPMRAIQFLVIFSLIFNSFVPMDYRIAHASETSTGARQRGSSRNPATSSQQDSVRLERSACPATLVDSVKNDKKASFLTRSLIGDIEDTCGNYSFTGKRQTVPRMTVINSGDKVKAGMEEIYGDHFSPALKNSLNGCSNLSAPDQAAIATRFYSAAVQIEDFNGKVADEISYIDSLISGGNAKDFECSEMLPKLKSRCPENTANKCSESRDKRLDDVADKTAQALAKLEKAEQLLSNCKNKLMPSLLRASEKSKQAAYQKNCAPEMALIAQIKDGYPWIDGAEFQKLAIAKPARCEGGGRGGGQRKCFPAQYKDKAAVKEAIKAQLNLNRKALVASHKKSMQDLRCLVYSNTDANSKCNFDDIRKSLSEMKAATTGYDKPLDDYARYNNGEKFDREGQPINPATLKSQASLRKAIELDTYFGIEQCYIRMGHDNQKFDKEVGEATKNAAIDIGIVVGTAGLGTVAAGARVVSRLGRFSQIARSSATVTGVAGGDIYYASKSVSDVYAKCKLPAKAAVDASSSSRLKADICEDAKSPLAQARLEQSDCREAALWALVDAAAVGVSLASLKNTLRANNASAGLSGTQAVTGNSQTSVKPVAEVKPAQKPASNASPAKKPEEKLVEKPVEKPTEQVRAPAEDAAPVDNLSEFASTNQNLTSEQRELGAALTTTTNTTVAAKPDTTTANSSDDLIDSIQEQINSTATNGRGGNRRTDRDRDQLAQTLETDFIAANRGQRVRVANADGGYLNAQITGLKADPNGSGRVEVAYNNSNGSISSREVEMREIFEANPQLRERLDARFYEIMSNGRNLQSDRAILAARNAPPARQQTTTGSFNPVPNSGNSLDTRSSSSISTMAGGSQQQAPVFNQKAAAQTVPRYQVSSLRMDSGSGGGGAVAVSINVPQQQASRSRAPASVQSEPAAPARQSVEDELLAAMNAPAATAVNISPIKARTSVKTSTAAPVKTDADVKVDDGTVVDKSTNARFVEGEQIRISNFEGGDAADFKVVKKLDNGLLRVADANGKEFDLLRDEVKSAQRLSLNGAAEPVIKAEPTPAKIGNYAPGELLQPAKVENVKLKEEFVRPGDMVSVKNFEGGGDLNASIVKKNTDGTLRVKDESGKEFDLVKSEVKGAEFSRDLPEEVRKNLEIPDEAERVKAAQNYVGRSLSPEQENAVIKSHKIASDKGIYTLSKGELKQKTKILRDAGFSDEEASLLLRKGVTGGTGLDNVRIVAEQPPVPKFEIVKGKQIQVPMGNTGRTNPGAVMSGPDKNGFYEVEFFQQGVGIGRTRKTAKELIAANVVVPPKQPNPVINVPVVGKDISYPGKVISGPNAKGQYEVEIYPPGKPATIVRMDELVLKRANTPLALRQAKIRDARHASFAKKSSAELEQIVSDSFRRAEGRGVRDQYDVSYGSSGKPDKTLKIKKIDVEGQKALEELAKRQSRNPTELYEEFKVARKTVVQPQSSAQKVSGMSSADVYNSPQAGGARNELDFLAEKDGLNGSKFNVRQRESIARELGITDVNRASAIDYGSIATRKETRDLFDRIMPGQRSFDADLLRQTMSYNPRGGYIGEREFSNAEKFVNAVKQADVSNLTAAERRLLNKYTDRAPLYARQANPDVALIPRQTLEVDVTPVATGASRSIASTSRAQVEDAAKTADAARNRLDYLAEQEGLKATRLTERQRESIARELGIFDENKTAALDYKSVGTKKEASALFDKLFPGKKDFDVELLRQSLSYNPRGGYLSNREFSNAEKFVTAIRNADIDGSTLSLSERRLLNRFTDRAPLYAQQITPETPLIQPQSLEAVVPPRITSVKVANFAGRGDEIVAQASVKPELAQKGDQVHLKNFEGGSDLHAKFVRLNKDGTARVQDSRGKEFNLSAQATSEARFYRGLTAELKVNGDLDMPSRVATAAAYLKRPLTPAQKDAIAAAHAVGGKERGYFDYTMKELREKTDILRKAGFNKAEASLLLRKGIAGSNPAELAQVIKVEPGDIRLGDRVTIDEFNGTGELRGEIVGPANNGGMILREANGTETIIYKSDLEDATNTRITRDPYRRSIASADESIPLERAKIVAVRNIDKAVPVPASEVRVGDRIVISEFNGTGELDAVVVGQTKNGGYLVRESDGTDTIIYKTDLEDINNTKVLRDWGTIPAMAKTDASVKLDFSPDSPVLVSKDGKNNPDIVVPLGNGELRLGRVLTQVEPKPGMAKSYVVEYADETGVGNQIQLTQEQLLYANTADALKKVQADIKRSTEYQAKSNTELQQILDEGNRAAKEAVGKGRPVDKKDLNAETQTALAELARRSGVTSRAVFEAYKRGGVKGVENLASAQKTLRAPASNAVPVVTPIIVKPLAQLKTGDFVVTAGIGDKVKLPKPVGTEIEGVVLGREKVNGEVIYTVGVKKDKSVVLQKMTDRELGDLNSSFVGIKANRSRSLDPQALRAQIDNDFANAKNEAQLAELRRKSRLKVEERNKIIYDDAKSNPLLVNSAGVTTPEGAVYINIDRDIDERFSTLLHEISHTKTDRINGDLAIRSEKGSLTAPGYGNGFFIDEIKAATVNFAVDKQTVIAQSKSGVPGVPNRAVKRDINHMQTSVDRRQGFINDTNAALDQIDEAIGSLVAKDIGRTGNSNYTIWEVTLNRVAGKDGPVKVNFSTPVNMSRSEAMAELRRLSHDTRISLLNAQSRLDYDKAYLTELRAKVGVPKPPEGLKGGSLVAEARAASSRSPASSGIKAQALDVNPATKELVEELDSVLGVRGRSFGMRDVNELTASHPLTPIVEKQRQIISRISRIDRQLQPENYTRTVNKIADDMAKAGNMDLAIPYYRASANTIYENLGSSAKSFWSSEANAKAAIRAGFISDNPDVARMATDKLIAAKSKSTTPEELKKVALDHYHNLGYEYDRVLYGVKRYGHKNKEVDLLVLRKQQQYLSNKYKLKDEIEKVYGKDSWVKVDEQADLTVEDLLSNPQQIIDPDKFKRFQRVPASTPAVEAPLPPSAFVPAQNHELELDEQVKKYVESIKTADLSPKEVKSVLHQEDLIIATQNASVAKVIEKAKVDVEGLKFGMLDSDVGKIAKFQEHILINKNKESDELFDTIRGSDQTPAGKEVKSILSSLGFANPQMLNPNISNQDIREIIAEVPVLRGYLHELPGMQLAIRDLNTGKITPAQFRERFLANLGHNGPDDGFWGFLSGTIVPNSLANAKHPKAKVLFANSIFASEKLPSGVVKPKYPMPQSPAGIVHSTFDRLSQGTRGGVNKIFYELGGTPLAANPKIAVRDVGVPPNKGLQLPHEMLFGNPEKTMRQLQALQQHAASFKALDKVQQTELSQLVGGAIVRLQKQNDYIKDHVELVRDSSGAIERMTLKFIDEVGGERKLVYTNDSAAGDIAKGMDQMLAQEERLHGDPFKKFKTFAPQAQPLASGRTSKLDQRHSQTALDYMIVNIAKRSDNEKSEAPEVVAFLMAYKNDPGFASWLNSKELPNAVHYDVKGNAQKLLIEYRSQTNRSPASIKKQDPVTVNLADPSLQEPSRLNAWQNERQINFKRSQYDNVISSLRKGDIVQAVSANSGKVESFELGDYIGAGNTSNLYATNDPNKVIRLPYLTSGVSGKKSGKEFFETYVQTRAKYEGIPGLEVVKVFDHGKNYEYIVNEKVRIRMTLNQVEDRLYDLKSGKKLTDHEEKEFSELQSVWDRFVKIAPEIAKRSNDQNRISSINSGKAADRDMALMNEARQVALTPDGRLVLLDWE